MTTPRLTPPTMPAQLANSQLPLVSPVTPPDLSTFISKFPWRPNGASVPPDVTIQPVDSNLLSIIGPTISRPNHIQPNFDSNKFSAAIQRWINANNSSQHSILRRFLMRNSQSLEHTAS